MKKEFSSRAEEMVYRTTEHLTKLHSELTTFANSALLYAPETQDIGLFDIIYALDCAFDEAFERLYELKTQFPNLYKDTDSVKSSTVDDLNNFINDFINAWKDK